ncbi:hypothetical protein KC131_24445 [Pseudomonas sp. JQ170]|uniref:hypothetical protein n=1 Tax=unclassified Pseudomonas TaxID=196821 RepID=UPI002655F295|nr:MULTISPECIES: hypothetical protein [unclassified Pseudomonas]MDN7143801.1 hypothetical protein [Pseudomonas sp. JQ170]WRO77721.1 hypothetical protein U9R80_08605 [Pseudomonas sp. 170C]
MSTFAVFGMTADVALAEARKITKTTRPSDKAGCPPLELTLAEWEEAVQQCAAAIMAGEKVKQLSQMFDAPQYAEQFVALTRKHCKCRDLRIRAKCALTDPEGHPIINEKSNAPKVGWADYSPGTDRARDVA